VLEARKFANISRLYGAHHGVSGIVNEDLLDLTQETTHNLEMVANTPSSALGSTRDKPDAKYCHEIFKVLQAHEIGAFFYIAAMIPPTPCASSARRPPRPIIPCAASIFPRPSITTRRQRPYAGLSLGGAFVAQAFAGANLDNAALPGVYVGVVMGRHAGFLTAASALGKKFPTTARI